MYNICTIPSLLPSALQCSLNFSFVVSLSFLMCYDGDGSGVRHVHIRCHGHSLYYQATVFALTFIVAMVTVVIGDACSKYHGHTHCYQATMLVIVINCLWLFVIVIMAMVVMGGHGHSTMLETVLYSLRLCIG